MSKDIETILIVNRYLTCCKISEPNSNKAKMVQKYLTSKISKTLSKRNNKKSILYYLSIIPLIFIR